MNGLLSPGARLAALAEMAGPCGTLADIGCDHGRLCGYMLQRDMCRRAVMTDISEASLEKARGLMKRLGLLDRAAFRVGDGAKTLDNPPDVAVIAGMGGQLIASIVEDGQPQLADARLVLQPNVAAPELRGRLCACGYRISDERVAREGRRLYVLLAAERGDAEYDERETVVGPVLLRERPPLLAEYAAFRVRVARKALAGAERGADDEAVRQFRREEEIWREFLP